MKIAIISDIHEDKKRLDKTLKELERRDIDDIFCLGDIVGFSAPFYKYINSRDANYVVDVIRNNCSVVVIGNHDLFAVKRMPTCSPTADFPENWYDLDYETRKIISSDRVYLYEENELYPMLTKSNIEYLKSIPEYEIKEIMNKNVLISHYYYPDFTGCFKFQPQNHKDFESHFDYMRNSSCAISFTGNDHFEGACVASPSEVIKLEFETYYKFSEDLISINCPTISKGTFRNGYIIFDFVANTLETVSLNSKIHCLK